jgi:hypothetical protein
MKHFEIYQVKNEHTREYGWIDYEEVIEYNGEFRNDVYAKVYESDIPGIDDSIILEELFETFNTSHPADYNGRSLSVSDVIVIDSQAYFCERFGWKEIEFNN